MKKCLIKKNFKIRDYSGKVRVFRKGEVVDLNDDLMPDTPMLEKYFLVKNEENAEMFDRYAEMFDRYESALSDLGRAIVASDDVKLFDQSKMKKGLMKKNFTKRDRSGNKIREFRKGDLIYLNDDLVPDAPTLEEYRVFRKGELVDLNDDLVPDAPTLEEYVLVKNEENAEMFDRYESALSDLRRARLASARNDVHLYDLNKVLESAEGVEEFSFILERYLDTAADALQSSLNLKMAEYREQQALNRLLTE